MPSKKQYNLVHDDAYDSRIPLHSEEAFQHGINFQAKYIGTLDVPRPSSRVEIVAAMRRIRYEFKAKAIKKKKVNIIVSVDGVKIVNRKKKKSQWMEDKAIVMHHPIYRIFYVSHDSQDLKIFSYIARDGASNVFKCNVFKSNKKSQAMRIVRTVGQAFEVCHKLSLHHSQQTVDGQEDAISERSSDVIINAEKNRKLKFPADGASEPNSCDTQTEEIPLQDPALQQQQQLIPDTSVGSVSASTSVSTPTTVSATGNLQRPNRLEPIPPPPDSDSNRGAPLTEGETYSSPMSKPLPAFDSLPNAGTPLSTHHQVQLLREQLDQQQQQTQVAIAQIHLLRDQLAAETAARLEVQARIHQLLVHNRELLDHIHRLVLQMQDLEAKTQGLENKTSPQRFQQQMQEYNYLTQIPITTPSSAPTSFPDYQSLVDPNQTINNLTADQASLYENHNPSISGLEPPTSPLQMCNSPVPSYGSGGVTPLHYSGSLNRSPSLRIQQQQQSQQQSHTPPINANEQLRQVLSNNNNFYQQQRTGNYYRSPPNTAPSAMLRQMQQTTPNEEMDQRYKIALAQQDSGGNRMDLSYLDNYSLPMPKLNPPPQRKRPTSRQSSLVNQHVSGQSEDALTQSDVNMCNSNEDLMVKQRLQLANSFLMSEQVNKLLDSDKSASDVTQQTLIDFGNMNLNERNKQLQQQFFQSNGPGSYVMNPPRSAPSTLTTYMDDTNLERLGRMQRMTWTRHTVGK